MTPALPGPADIHFLANFGPVPLKYVKDNTVVWEDWPILMTSHMFQSMASNRPNVFESMMAESGAFWRERGIV